MDGRAKIERMFLDYGSDVHHFLAYCCGHSQVEDLVQEVFLKALKGLHRFEGRAGPRTWLFAIARRTAIDAERKRRIARLLPFRLLGEREVPVRTPDELFFHREDVENIYRIIRKLKRSDRDVIFLRLMQSFSAAETAQIMGWTATRVNAALHRAIKKVRESYQQREGGAEYAADGGKSH